MVENPKEIGRFANTPYRLSRASEADAQTLVYFWEEAGSWLQRIGSDQWNSILDLTKVKERIATKEVYILFDKEKPIGSITLGAEADPDFWTPEEQSDSALYFHKLSVLRTHKGQHLGAKLIDWAETQAAEQNNDWLRCDVWRTNKTLHAYYRDQGFTELRTVFASGRGSGTLFQRAVRK